MTQFLVLIVASVFFTEIFGAERSSSTEKKQQLLVPLGPNEYPADFPYNINYLEPQLQYPPTGGFNYVPNKQPSFARSQPPLVILAGPAPPGQQFLLQQPVNLPGNFLIPQPEGPNILLGGNPSQQNPVLIGGYPKTPYVPSIDKDAEEIPNLAGNHPISGNPLFAARRPEKLETLDEPQIPTEADELAAAGKNPSPFPKKFPAPQQPLKPDQRFFILNGQPLYANYPTHPQQYQPHINSQPDLFYLRQPPQFIPPQFFAAPLPHQQNYQGPVQDLLLRNDVNGEIAGVRSLPVMAYDQGNFIALNQPEDFRHQGLLLKNPVLSASQVELAKNGKSGTQTRLGKNIQFSGQPAFLHAPQILPAYGGGYYFKDLKNTKDEDDTIVIDAKVQDETESEALKPLSKKEEEEGGSLSQAQPLATAVAGVGGVAAAAPRGTALVGPKGVAISSPQATAVAGPKSEEEDDEKEKNPKSKREHQ